MYGNGDLLSIRRVTECASFSQKIEFILTVNRRPQENAALQRKEAGNFVFPRC
jgi:hypothetical protein